MYAYNAWKMSALWTLNTINFNVISKPTDEFFAVKDLFIISSGEVSTSAGQAPVEGDCFLAVTHTFLKTVATVLVRRTRCRCESAPVSMLALGIVIVSFPLIDRRS